MDKTEPMIIYKSKNGRDHWKPVMPEDVPNWVIEPRILGRLVAGEICMDPQRNDGNTWWKAVKINARVH